MFGQGAYKIQTIKLCSPLGGAKCWQSFI